MCKVCPDTGATCRGALNGSAGVSAKRGYYGLFEESNDRRESSDYDLSMILCPPEQCCQYDSCVVNGTDECPPTRNAGTPLCGSCVETLSETLGSVECRHCSSNNWLLIVAYLLGYCAIGCYLLYSLKSTAKSVVADSQIIITKCLVYCYQTIPLLVEADSVSVVLQPLLAIFALKTPNGDGEGVCFIAGMDAMGKLLVPLMGPLFLLAVVLAALLVAILRSQPPQTQQGANEEDAKKDAANEDVDFDDDHASDGGWLLSLA